ncbi:YceD family protein [Carboxylicivirga caseinilyticus]|uniref:YceD family protein n=1 Tax=Carboxylicivirga caseinilyticus TaxID=3417572 RepID=UPI003D354ECF|nr:DUF177 domain-containing protein [Marinilabiliaceae bacterium A049]
MDRRRDYDIPFKGLKEGLHEFNFEISESFFKLFEQPLVENGNVKAKVELKKSSALMSLTFDISGEVESVCDHCLDALNLDVNYHTLVYLKFGEEYDEPTDEIIVLPHEAHEINVAQLLYEFICVGLPIRHVHPEDEDGNLTCDPEMLNRLDEYLVEEASDEEQDDYIDPRWEALKNLVNKNK